MRKNYASPERGGGPPSGGGEVRPLAPTLCIAVARVGGSALREQPLRPLCGQLPFHGSHWRLQFYHTLVIDYASPERGGGPPLGGGEVRPPAPTLCFAVARVGGSALRGQPLGQFGRQLSKKDRTEYNCLLTPPFPFDTLSKEKSFLFADMANREKERKVFYA